MKKHKKKYSSMELVRIKLNPEQAVLTCCDSSGRVQLDPYAGTPTWQCHPVIGTCGTAMFSPSS